MRRFFISVAVIGLVGSTSLAIAQDRGGHDGPRGGERGGPQAQSAPNPTMNGRGAIGERLFREHHDAPSPQPAPARPMSTAQAQTPADAAARQMRDINRAIGNAPQPNAGRPERPDFRGQDNRRDDRDRDRDRGRDNDRRDFNNGNNRRPDFNDNRRRDFNDGRGDRGRRDFSNYRNYHQNFRASQRFRAAPYRRPPGYFARRWSWGQTLPVAFWTRDYWLTDFYAYDLPPPPYGAIWVRVGDDALLIDQYTGEIIEVDYGVFY